MNRYRKYFIIVAFAVMGIIIPHTSGFAQSKEQVAELERIALYGSRQELIDSLSVAYGGGADSANLMKVEALLAIREGRNAFANEWYDELTSRNKRRYENLLLGCLIAIHDYQLEVAKERLSQLKKMRLRDEDSQAEREATIHLYGQVERLLKNARAIEVLDIERGSLGLMMERLQSYTPHLGVISRDAYITPDGLTKWEVAIDDDAAPAFSVVHKLGDGSWDYANTERVVVRGLPDDAKLSYPRLMADGNTLYFVIEERGVFPQNGLGEKDIYVSRYDREAKALLVPQLLPMPFNSPADDFVYLTDEASDLGWLITSRGLQGGEVRLFTFRLSSVKRYEGDNVVDVALLNNPEVTGGGVSHKPIGTGQSSLGEERAVYFWIHNKPIRGEDDLKSRGAKNLFHQYLSSAESLKRLEERLGLLRKQISDESNQMSRMRHEVLAIEERVEVMRAQTQALCNEVIKLEIGER